MFSCIITTLRSVQSFHEQMRNKFIYYSIRRCVVNTKKKKLKSNENITATIPVKDRLKTGESDTFQVFG